MTIMNTHRHKYHWKDEKKPSCKIIFRKGKNPLMGQKFLKTPILREMPF